MEQRDFQHLWTTDEDGEHEKYEKIRARLTADDKIREQREKEIIQQCAHWADRLRSQATRLTGERDDLKLLFDTITKVQFNWASNMQADSGQAAYLSNLDYHRDHGQLFRLKRVVIPGCDNTTAKELAVTTTLSHSRYYLGHQGGDYIFRYRDRHDAGLDDPLNMRSMLENEPTWPSDIWNNPHWLSQFLTDDSELEMMNRFTYCGQVPRPQKEYMARLETLYPDVIAIASSIIHFLAETQGKCPCSLYQRLPPADLGRLAIAFLQRLWVYCMHDDRDRMVLHVQSKAKNNPKILEFAFVVARVAAVHRRILIEMGPLLTVLEAATGLTLFEMINQYDLRAAEIAHQELFRTGDFTHFMVFEDDSIDDVHQFYNSSQFHSDPSHPLRQYRHLDVSAALEASNRLGQLDWAKAAPPTPAPTPAASSPSADSFQAAPKKRGRPRKHPVVVRGAGTRGPVNSGSATATAIATGSAPLANSDNRRTVNCAACQPSDPNSAILEHSCRATEAFDFNSIRVLS